MPNTTQRQNNIGGFNPAVSRSQSSNVRVLAGRNFRWDFDGPFSGWGSVQVSDQFLGNSKLPHYQTFNLNDAIMLFTPNGVYRQVAEGCPWDCVLSLTPHFWEDCDDNDYPWTSAFVGDSYFFSHPSVGLIKYDTYKCEWSCVLMACPQIEGGEAEFYDFSCPEKGCLVTGPIFGITQAGNRLIIQARDTVGWSKIDDGCTLHCDPFCAGGFVSSSVMRYGKPLGVYETADGFAAMGSNGIVRGAAVDSIAAFNVAMLTSKSYPINPYAVATLDNFQLIMLTAKGFYSVANNQIAPWEPQIAGWVNKLLRSSGLRNIMHAVRLTYAEDTDELFVSFIPKMDQYYYANLYTRALVHDFETKKWGSFDQPHYAIGPVNAAHKLTQVNLGFISWQQSLCWFNYGEDNAVGDNTTVGNLDSFVSIGPFQVSYEEILKSQSKLTSFELHVEAKETPAFNFGLNDLLPSKFDSRDNWELEACKNFNALVFVKGSDDAYGLDALEQLAEAEEVSSSFIKNYTCETVGNYHIISLIACEVSAYYSVKSVGVQLQVLEAKA